MSSAIVIGGGFYGVMVALYLKRRRGFRSVQLIERETSLLTRASFNNQARVHNGYHYPRSFTTAFRSRVNFPLFNRDFEFAVDSSFTKLYAIARAGSKVTARQFERFCLSAGAQLKPASRPMLELFDPRRIERVFQVVEYAFDAARLREWAQRELADAEVSVTLGANARHVDCDEKGVRLGCDDARGQSSQLEARYLFNCTYSGLNMLEGVPRATLPIKHEIAELALVRVPAQMAGLGITVIDGPFFSCMPFPARGLHTLSHVRYTPHFAFADGRENAPYDVLARYPRESRVDRMMRDSSRYMPLIAEAEYVDSLFEVKTVLAKNETDDGRPILYERHATRPNVISVLGAKIDNIYDVLERLEREPFDV